MPLSEEKSIELAECIELMKFGLRNIDLEYLKEAAIAMKESADNYDSAAALNRNYTPTHSKVLHAGATSLRLLNEYIESLNEVERLKIEDKAAMENIHMMNKLFM